MHSKPTKDSDLKSRLLYGAVLGAVIGMIIGTMPQNNPVLALASMVFTAGLVSVLCALCDSFWESLRAAWELLQISFWRW